MISPAKRTAQRLLFVTHYYPPESNAPAGRVSELARHWAAAGRRVEIVTGMPNHPSGVVPPAYRGAWYRREEKDGVTVHRGRVYPAANRGHVRRTLNYLSFMISAILTGALKCGRADCVIATSPQIFCGVAGWILSVIMRAPFVFEVRDVWPQEIVAVGAIRNRSIIRLLEALEMFLYRRASHIVAVAQGTVDILTARGVPRQKITVIANGVDTATFVPGTRQNWVRRIHNLNGEFLVSYIGTIGMAHRLDVVLDAAERLRDHANIRFLMVGDGAERSRLAIETHRRHLPNVLWEKPQPRERIVAYYQAADACLVHLRRADLFTRNIPSKMYEIMATGRPILLGTEGESRALGLAARCAEVFAPEDGTELARAILALAADRDKAERLGTAGRQFAERHCDRSIRAGNYLNVLDAVGVPGTADMAPAGLVSHHLAHAKGTLHTL